MARFFEKVSYADNGIIPTRNDKASAGYDFYIPNGNDIIIAPKEVVVLPTNIKVCMEEDEALLLYVRSSIGIKRGLVLANGTGVIDSSYYNNEDNEGNIACALYNYTDTPQVIKPGERVMQGVFTKYLKIDNDQPLNEERVGGIGSSGK